MIMPCEGSALASISHLRIGSPSIPLTRFSVMDGTELNIGNKNPQMGRGKKRERERESKRIEGVCVCMGSFI